MQKDDHRADGACIPTREGWGAETHNPVGESWGTEGHAEIMWRERGQERYRLVILALKHFESESFLSANHGDGRLTDGKISEDLLRSGGVGGSRGGGERESYDQRNRETVLAALDKSSSMF